MDRCRQGHYREQYRAVKVDRIDSINFADYDLVLALVVKDFERVLRNLSFGMVRQRQQLGMIVPAMTDTPQPGNDRRNLYEYFVKIPANIATGTFGVMNQRLPKNKVHAWLERKCGFATTAMQQLASNGDSDRALAESTVATGAHDGAAAWLPDHRHPAGHRAGVDPASARRGPSAAVASTAALSGY